MRLKVDHSVTTVYTVMYANRKIGVGVKALKANIKASKPKLVKIEIVTKSES